MININNFFVVSLGFWDEISQVPKGFTCFFQSRGSSYYTNKDNTKLVRKSNHWGWGIKKCTWFIKGYEMNHCGDWQQNVPNPMRIAIIDYKDLSLVV